MPLDGRMASLSAGDAPFTMAPRRSKSVFSQAGNRIPPAKKRKTLPGILPCTLPAQIRSIMRLESTGN
jgi:hypothetical protein